MAHEYEGTTKERLSAPVKSIEWLSGMVSDCVREEAKFVERIDYNRKHFFKDKSVNPVLLPPYKEITYQSNRPAEVWREVKSRMCENHALVQCRAVSGKPKDSARAEEIGEAWNAAILLREENLGYSIQDGLSDGQIIDGRGVLGWRRWDQGYPGVPEYEYCDEIPDGDDPEEWRAVEEGDEPKAKGRKYMTSEASLKEKLARSRAKYGFPYQWEVFDSRNVKFWPDELGEVGVVCHLRTLRVMDYRDGLEGDGLALDLTRDVGARVYAHEVASEGDPLWVGVDGARKRVTVCTLWTRDAWYELFTDRAVVVEADWANTTGWELVKSGRHAFGRPPFDISPALRFNHPEPHRKWQAYLSGMLDLKPRVDFQMALMIALATAAAQKMKFLKRDPKAVPGLAEDGGEIDLTTDATVAKYLPPGTTLETFSDDVSQGFVSALKLAIEEYEKATPPTPAAEISATTQPWTARLQIQVSSVLTKQGIGSQAMSFQAMVRSIMRDIQTAPEDGGFGQCAYVYKRGADGREDFSQVVAIEPEDVPTLEYYVNINAISAAEQITTTEHGKGLLAEGYILREDFYENFYTVRNSAEYMAKLDGEALFNTHLKPGLMAQAVGEVFGAKYVMGPDGKFLGLGGQEVPPGGALASRGWKAQAPPAANQAPGMPQSTGMQGAMVPQLGPGDLQDQPPPGVVGQPALLDGVAR